MRKMHCCQQAASRKRKCMPADSFVGIWKCIACTFTKNKMKKNQLLIQEKIHLFQNKNFFIK